MFELHQISRGSDAQGGTDILTRWYAIYTRSRYEKRVAVEFNRRKIEHFLPLVSRLHQWKDRKKIVDMPLFPGYVFVRINLQNRFDVLNINGVVRLVGFSAEPSPIPDEQIDNVRRVITRPDLVQPHTCLQKGDRVEIVSGPFAGVQGKLYTFKGKKRVLICIDLIGQAVSIEVEVGNLRRLQPETKSTGHLHS